MLVASHENSILDGVGDLPLTRIPNSRFDMEKIIFEWTVPADHPNITGHDDLPAAYRVVENEDAACGIIVYAKWRGKWEVNPWNTRTLIKHLLDQNTI